MTRAREARYHRITKVGDVRREGRYASYQTEVIARMPREELRVVLIKAQHNVRSDRTHYELPLPRIIHEYIVLWQRFPSFRKRGA